MSHAHHSRTTPGSVTSSFSDDAVGSRSSAWKKKGNGMWMLIPTNGRSVVMAMLGIDYNKHRTSSAGKIMSGAAGRSVLDADPASSFRF